MSMFLDGKVLAWKLFRRRKDGTLGSLFINRRDILEPGKWLHSSCWPTQGYALRTGWHCTEKKSAPHLSKKGRVWRRVEISGYIEVFKRPRSQGGVWYTATRMRILP